MTVAPLVASAAVSIRLSVNLNKVATIRNARTAQPEDASRGFPSLTAAATTCIAAGAGGITVHPRPDGRHVTMFDVRELAELVGEHPEVEFNVEGDPRQELIDLVLELGPDQFTLVPVRPGELTSEAGWPASTPAAPLRALIARMHGAGVRVSMFVNPRADQIRWAASLGADRVELFTEPFAAAFARSPQEGATSFSAYVEAASIAQAAGLDINAGHDLDDDNLQLFRTLEGLSEVSIGHALVGQALFDGLDVVVRRYLEVLNPRVPR